MRNSSNTGFLNRLLKADIKAKLVSDMLTKVDRVSMLNSLEVRVPFLDHKLAELSFKIPPDLKLKNNVNKYIVKKTMEKYLMPSILDHKKQGFSIPLGLWFKNDLKDYVEDELVRNNTQLSGYFNKSYVSKIIKNHNTGTRSFNHHIWSLLFLNEWFKQNELNV